jgi:cytochrome c biogenesis protein CcdA
MEIVFLTISKMKTTKQMKDVLMFSLAVAILGVTLMLGALATQEAGVSNVLWFAGTLAVFTIIMGGVFLSISKMKTTKQMKDVLTFSLAVGILGAVLIAGGLATKEAGWDNVEVTWVLDKTTSLMVCLSMNN